MQPPGFGIKGLVGLNFLKSYRVTIDFERNLLRLDKPGRNQNQSGIRQSNGSSYFSQHGPFRRAAPESFPLYSPACRSATSPA